MRTGARLLAAEALPSSSLQRAAPGQPAGARGANQPRLPTARRQSRPAAPAGAAPPQGCGPHPPANKIANVVHCVRCVGCSIGGDSAAARTQWVVCSFSAQVGTQIQQASEPMRSKAPTYSKPTHRQPLTCILASCACSVSSRLRPGRQAIRVECVSPMHPSACIPCIPCMLSSCKQL